MSKMSVQSSPTWSEWRKQCVHIRVFAQDGVRCNVSEGKPQWERNGWEFWLFKLHCQPSRNHLGLCRRLHTDWCSSVPPPTPRAQKTSRGLILYWWRILEVEETCTMENHTYTLCWWFSVWGFYYIGRNSRHDLCVWWQLFYKCCGAKSLRFDAQISVI